MFLESFEQSNSKPEFKHKQIKKQYSAGFRNYHPKKGVIDEETNAQSESDIFQMLKIGNLKQLYMQTIPKVDNTKLVLQQQKKSIMRLTKMPEKQQNIQINEEQDEQKRKENIQIFNKTYHEVQGFSQKGEKMLFQNEYKKIKEKLIQIYNKIYKKEVSFKDVFVKYVLNYADKYTKKLKIENDELCLDFSNYLNSLKRSQKQSEKSISHKELVDLRLKNIFLFGFFDIEKSQKQTFQFKNLSQIVRENIEFQLNIQGVRHFINKKITVPLQSTSIHPHRQTKNIEVKQKQEVFQKFHAKAIPKTTYQKPKERPKSQMTKTQPQPFNLTNTNSNMPKIQDYYKWQRQFHAKGVPDTTYKPLKIEAGNEDKKRKRALQLLYSSKYPENMKYLNNYKEYNQKKQSQLSQKYRKQRTQQQQRSIPNFAEIHRRNIQTMESNKVENRQLTKTKPFNLSQPRPPKPQKETQIPIMAEKQYDISRKKQVQGEEKIKLQPKSTLKYDTYVNHLKKQKEIKIQQQEIKKKQQKKKQKPQYKQILKERLQDEIKGKSKNFSPQKLTNNIVKVDLQKIYQYEPLLIERQAIKSKKETQSHTKNWQPII